MRTIIQLMALAGLVTGFFTLFGISFREFSDGLFAGILGKPKGIREEILEETKQKKKSFVRRELEEVQEILETTKRTQMFPFLCMLSLILFTAGCVVAVFLGNLFLVPALAVGSMFLPFWYIRLTANHYKKNVSAELETALSVITTAYLRSEDLIGSVEENVGYLNPPVKTVFEDFLTRVRMVDPDVEAALKDMKGRIDNEVFQEWVDAVSACQFDRSLKNTLVPIVAKLSDMRVVNAELEYLVMEPRKEFITMVVLVVANIPLLYFLNKDWYHCLMHTLPGQIMLGICGAVIFVSTAFVIRLTRPIEYRT